MPDLTTQDPTDALTGKATRRQILLTARALFNQQSVKAVSLRAIAAAAGISVGNLTYYFPHKADLVRALMTEDVQETVVQREPTGLLHLHLIFSNMLDALQRSPFYFLDPAARAMAGETGRFNQQSVHGQIDPALDRLIQQGLLSPSFVGNTRARVISVLVWSHIAWVGQIVREPQSCPMSQEEFLRAHWEVLAPWLTEAGRSELLSMQSNTLTGDKGK